MSKMTKLQINTVCTLLMLISSQCSAFLSLTGTPAAKTYATTTSSSLYASSSTYKKVFVAGGSKGVGRCIIDQLASSGIEVKALVRSDTVAAELNTVPGVTAIVGDAFVIKDVENAMDGCDAAITTLGGSNGDTGTANQRIDYVGNNHVIESAGILGVTRVILVTSVGCGTSKAALPASAFDKLKDVLAAKERAENILIRYYTNTKWTIIRPGGLKSDGSTGSAILTDDPKAIGTINREDVAKLVIDALDSSKTEQKILAAIDPTIESSYTVEGIEYPAFAL